jgi:hypothetical protein
MTRFLLRYLLKNYNFFALAQCLLNKTANATEGCRRVFLTKIQRLKGQAQFDFYKIFDSGRKQSQRRRATTLMNKKVQTNRGNLLESRATVDMRVFGEKVGILVKLFGCGHRNLSRPFSHNKIAYRACLQCGARKQFNTQTLETFGGFYNSPKSEAAVV